MFLEFRVYSSSWTRICNQSVQNLIQLQNFNYINRCWNKDCVVKHRYMFYALSNAYHKLPSTLIKSLLD
jgi:hypothetical protein